jgi:hypothetical protein
MAKSNRESTNTKDAKSQETAREPLPVTILSGFLVSADPGIEAK